MQLQRLLRAAALVGAGALVLSALPFAGTAQAASTCAPNLGYGASSTCAITKTGQVVSFTLTAAANDVIYVHALAQSAGLDIDFDVRDAANKVLCAARAGASSALACKAPVAGK